MYHSVFMKFCKSKTTFRKFRPRFDSLSSFTSQFFTQIVIVVLSNSNLENWFLMLHVNTTDFDKIIYVIMMKIPLPVADKENRFYEISMFVFEM